MTAMKPPTSEVINASMIVHTDLKRVSETDPTETRKRLFILSALDKSSLQRLANVYKDHLLKRCNNINLDDFAYTLSEKRARLPWKSFLIADSVETLSQKLSGLELPTKSSKTPNLCLVFTGQGATWHAMGQELMVYPVFRDSLAESERSFEAFGAQWSLIGKSSLASLEKIVNLLICQRSFQEIAKPLGSMKLCSANQFARLCKSHSFNFSLAGASPPEL